MCFNCKRILINLKSQIKFETSDLLEMLENLKTSFKLKNGMDLLEERVNISAYDIIESISKTHKKLAINGFNAFKVGVDEQFPTQLNIQKTLFKRVVNNIISNSLKHTYCGEVKVMLIHTDKVGETCNKIFNSE